MFDDSSSFPSDEYDGDESPAAPCPVITLVPAAVDDAGAVAGDVSSADSSASEVAAPDDQEDTDLPAPPVYVRADDVGPEVAAVEDAISRLLIGNDPGVVADILDAALSMSEPGMRPVDTMRLCKRIEKMTGQLYDSIKERILSRNDHVGHYPGYQIEHVKRQRRVDMDALEADWPEAAAATMWKPGPEDFSTRLTLDPSS